VSTKQHNWLIISYFANEGGMACSHHIDDRLPAFAGKKINVTLLTSTCVKKLSLINHIRIPSISPSGIRFEVRHVLRRREYSVFKFKLLNTLLLLPVLPFYFIEKLIYRIDATWWWFLPAFLRGYFQCLKCRPDVIYSTGGPISAHIAAAILSKVAKIPWIAEFQDPLVHSYCARSSIELRLTKWAERLICSRADKVVFLTSQALEHAFKRTGNNGNGVVIYPGAPVMNSGSTSSCSGDYLNFVHLGSLGGSRNLASFLEALDALAGESSEVRSKIRVSLFGSFDNNVKKQIETFPYDEMVRSYGRVTRERSLEEMQKSDVLLLIQNLDAISSETIPSKVYEYFQARRPILGLLYNNGELAEMFNGLGHRAVQWDDIEGIQQGIREYFSLWKLGKLTQPTPASPYTIEHAITCLINEMQP
jgi:hypothetical protein